MTPSSNASQHLSTRCDVRDFSCSCPFLTGDRKCLTNSTVAHAVLGNAAAIITICQHHVSALALIVRIRTQPSRRAVGVTYAHSFP